MKRRSISLSGVFLIMIGSVSLAFSVWYAWTYGFSSDFSARDILFPELSGNLLWLISVSCSAIVLGVIFVLWTRTPPE